jgi:hypothetical protein
VRVEFVTRRLGNAGYGTLRRLYRLERSPDLNPGSWAPIPGVEPVVGTGQTVRYEARPEGAARYFYRCVVTLE